MRGRWLVTWLTVGTAIGCGAGAVPVPIPVAASASRAPSEWSTYGYDGTRTSTNPHETAISKDQVGVLRPLWQADIGSSQRPSFSGPTVADGKVFIGSSVATGDNFFAFDAATGALAWSADLGHRADDPCDAVGIASTAAVANGIVTVGGGDGDYFGLEEATGAVRWRHPLEVGPSGYAWTSPLILGQRVFVGVASECDNPSVPGELRVLDLQTGDLVAAHAFSGTDIPGGGLWNSPTATADARRIVVATGEDNGGATPEEQALVVLDADSLATIDAFKVGPPGDDGDFGSTPVVFGDSKGRTLAGAFRKRDQCFYAFDLQDVAAGPVWSHCGGTLVGTVAAYDASYGSGGTLFLPGFDGPKPTGGNAVLYAVDPATGLDRRAPTRLDFLLHNVAIANGLIFVNGGAAGLHIIDETTGAILRTLTPDSAGATLSGVTVAEGRIYWLSGAKLNVWG